jgi:protein tyrosine phosphatase
MASADEQRSIYHIFFTAWPDHGVPESPRSMLQLQQYVSTFIDSAPTDESDAGDTTTSKNGPVVVHCSAGCGRTGTFCAIDLILREPSLYGSMKKDAVYETVRHLRKQRIQSVQSEVHANLMKKIMRVLMISLASYCSSCTFAPSAPNIMSSQDHFY